MEYEKYIIVFSYQTNRRDYYYFDHLLDFLDTNKKTLKINSVSLHDNPLVNRCFTYILQKDGLDHLIGTLANFKVLKLIQSLPPFGEDGMLEEAIKDCLLDVEGKAYLSCFYLVEQDAKLQFRRFSRNIDKGVAIDDDHMEMDGLISGHPDMFYRHLYCGDVEFNPEDTAYLAKILLTIDAREQYDF